MLLEKIITIKTVLSIWSDTLYVGTTPVFKAAVTVEKGEWEEKGWRTQLSLLTTAAHDLPENI